MTRLRDAAAEGRLTFEELADRVEAAVGALTRSDLDAGSIVGYVELLVPEGVEVEIRARRSSPTSSRRPGKRLLRVRRGSS
jgi:hypothetical protein